MSLRRVVLLAAACVAGLASASLAQRPVRPSPARPGSRDTLTRRVTVRAKGDTAAVPDTATKATLVEPDSVMRRLMGLPGYDSKVYQAETITLDALTRGICLARSAQAPMNMAFTRLMACKR